MKMPAFQFYPADWRKDLGIQSLSFHDRGVWFEILCLMHESEQRGKLLLNGIAMSDEALARLLGLDKQNLNKTLTTLLEYGVASRDVNGVLMNRRMVRDEELRKIRQEAGKMGGNPFLLKQNPGKPKKPDKQNQTPSSASSSAISDMTPCMPAGGQPPDVLDHWAVRLLEEKLGVVPSMPGQELIAANVEDESVWRQVLEIWQVNSHSAYKVWNIVDRYRRELGKSKAPANRKSAKPSTTAQSSDEWRGYYAKELGELIRYLEDAEARKKVELLLSDLPQLDYERFCQRRGELEDSGLEIG